VFIKNAHSCNIVFWAIYYIMTMRTFTITFSFLPILTVLSIFLCWHNAFAQEPVIFPYGVGVLDVTREPYFAKGDGKTDDTRAIQKALDDYPNGNRIIYLPKGVYLVSSMLSWPEGTDTTNDYRRTILQGEHMEKTIIKLADKANGFGSASIPRAVVYTGLGPARRFRNAVRDLTIYTGKGNNGAIGIRFNATQQGTIRNVRIISPDKKGAYGIDMGFAPDIGPLMIKNVLIQGFDVGLFTRFDTKGITIEDLELKDQNKFGIDNQGQSLHIKGLRSFNAVPAIRNITPTSYITLINSRLNGPSKKPSPEPAIINYAGLFFRNVTVDRYGLSIKNMSDSLADVSDLAIMEYSTQQPHIICASPATTMTLPIAETPNVYWGNANTWISVSGDYGGVTGDGSDDSYAIQEAIDDGAETLIFTANGRYTINKDVYIRKNLRRIIGAEARIDGIGRFVIEDGVPPMIAIERFDQLAGGIFHKSSRPLVVQNVIMNGYESIEVGAGNVYMEDVSGGPFTFNYQKVWARQLHINTDKLTRIRNNGGTIWILGLTTERTGTIVDNYNQGQVEILGARILNNGGAQRAPMFVNTGSNLTIAGLVESSVRGNQYSVLVQEQRGEDKRMLSRNQVQQGASGSIIDVYNGYTPRGGINKAPIVHIGGNRFLIQPNTLALNAMVEDDGRAAGHCQVPGEWLKISGDGIVQFQDAKAAKTKSRFSYSGSYLLAYAADDGQAKTEDTITVTVFDKAITTEDHMGNAIPSGKGADAYISSAQPDQNFGKQKETLWGKTTASEYKTYLRFDLTQIPRPITDGALAFTLKPSKQAHTGVFAVYGLVDSVQYGSGKEGMLWQEHSLTWNNAPANTLNGLDPSMVRLLGTVADTGGITTNGILRSPELTKFLMQNQSNFVTFILIHHQKEQLFTGSAKELLSVRAPSLLISYISKDISKTGQQLPGGFSLSEVEVDPYTLACTFFLEVSYLQNVEVTLHKENGERVMRIFNSKLGYGKENKITFDASGLRSGRYTIQIKGEGFRTSANFFLLN
jgi:hypothetical protein